MKPDPNRQRVVGEIVVKSDLFTPTNRGPLYVESRFFLTDGADKERILLAMLRDVQSAIDRIRRERNEPEDEA